MKDPIRYLKNNSSQHFNLKSLGSSLNSYLEMIKKGRSIQESIILFSNDISYLILDMNDVQRNTSDFLKSSANALSFNSSLNFEESNGVLTSQLIKNALRDAKKIEGKLPLSWALENKIFKIDKEEIITWALTNIENFKLYSNHLENALATAIKVNYKPYNRVNIIDIIIESKYINNPISWIVENIPKNNHKQAIEIAIHKTDEAHKKNDIQLEEKIIKSAINAMQKFKFARKNIATLEIVKKLLKHSHKSIVKPNMYINLLSKSRPQQISNYRY